MKELTNRQIIQLSDLLVKFEETMADDSTKLSADEIIHSLNMAMIDRLQGFKDNSVTTK